MDDDNTIIIYDDENEFADHNYHPDSEYEYEYERAEHETVADLYRHCLSPVIYDTLSYMLPLFMATCISRLLYKFQLPSPLYDWLSIVLGVCIVRYHASESFLVMIAIVVISYTALYLPDAYRNGLGNFLPSILIIGYCELSMQSEIWHKVRGLVMVSAMKSISVAADLIEKPSSGVPHFYRYAGYILSAPTCLFGPWISFKDYIAARQPNHQDKLRILSILLYGFGSFFFLSVSTCWSQWFIANYSWKWLIAYRDALAFRTSHYFVSYAASTMLLLGGYHYSLTNIVKPLEIEFPRSLVQVVIYWNIPMHFWLKKYIFRPSIRQFGKFKAVIITFATSSLLHGLNFQLTAVLLSLGLYTYIEFEFRRMLADTFDACIMSKQCVKHNCTHKYNSRHVGVIITNFMFSVLSMFHLAYLGLMFDTSELQETGYSYVHTMEKWSQLGFASHWVAFGTYCIYILVR